MAKVNLYSSDGEVLHGNVIVPFARVDPDVIFYKGLCYVHSTKLNRFVCAVVWSASLNDVVRPGSELRNVKPEDVTPAEPTVSEPTA
jgi:hypothetical protein